jgi:hypothetical protein
MSYKFQTLKERVKINWNTVRKNCAKRKEIRFETMSTGIKEDLLKNMPSFNLKLSLM